MSRSQNIVVAFGVALLALFAGASGCGSSGNRLFPSSGSAGASGSGGAGTGGAGVDGGTGGGVSSSSSGTGGAPACDASTACTTAKDCAASSTACVVVACTDGCCATSDAAAGTMCMESGGTVCDGKGSCVACVLPSDCPAPVTNCQINTCKNGVCGTIAAAVSTSCMDNGGTVCDASGNCVACVAPSDCPPTGTTCATSTCTGNACGTTFALKATPCNDHGGSVCDGNGMCVAPGCTDGFKDGNETDVDCGGSCAPCADGRSCAVNADCADGVCSGSPKTCQAPTCSDGVQNGAETDVDCGGPTCPKCADKLHCKANTDCKNGLCFGSGPGTCVSCMDGAKDGSETDVDCGGPSCDLANKTCAVGKACAVAADCQSGVCQGGVCAVKPNGGTCTANPQCASGACVMGMCCATPCSDMGASSCGENGACKSDGSGCLDYASGTVCAPASCTDGPSGSSQSAATSCDGAGNCDFGGATVSCGPYKCGGTTCRKSCTNDSDCVSGNFCTTSGMCVPVAGNGAPCSGDGQCTSGHCVGGVCCGVACADQGASSCGTNGQCNAVYTGCALYPSGTTCAAPTCVDGASGSDFVAAMTCNGSGACNGGGAVTSCGLYTCGGASCKTSCASNADCVAGTYCTAAHTCAPLAANGSPCIADGACQSGHCVSGICCAVTCSDQGAASCGNDGQCNGAGTACADYPTSTQCKPASCSDGPMGSFQTTATSCNGSGACSLGGVTTSCGGYKCGATTCKTACATSADCAAGYYCSGGACVPQITNGSSCTSGGQCASGNCMGNICCAVSCTDMGAASCGTTGACNTAGTACADYAAGTQCVAPFCVDGAMFSFQTAAVECNGSGSCNLGGGQTSCGAYRCGGTACKTSCTTSSDCASGYTCSASHTCLLANGGACASNAACASGICGVNGTGNCCAAPCVIGGACGATSCGTTGACAYPSTTTSCNASSCSGSTLTTWTACNGAGQCSAGNSSAACAGHLVCASSTSCLTGCGTSDANCVAGYYCDGVGAGACQAKLGPGSGCSRNGQCADGTCSSITFTCN